MKTRLASGLAALAVLAVTAASGAAVGSSEAPASPTTDAQLIARLCGAAATTDVELASCIEGVNAALTRMQGDRADEEKTLLGQAAEIGDRTLDDLRRIDVEAIFSDAVDGLEDIEIDVDVQGAIDDALAALDALDTGDIASDAQRVVEEAVGEVLTATEDIDLGAAIDEALADVRSAIDEAGLQASIDDTVATIDQHVAQARAVVAEAQAWARENREAVCRGGSIGLGATVGLTVVALTGVEWLGLQAFWATQRSTNSACAEVIGS